MTLGLRRRRVASDVRGEWLEPAETRRGVLLYVHGGGFVSCSAATHRPITAALARYCKRRVFSADYRLAPEHRFPSALDDVCVAYSWLQRQAPGEPIALVGDSAGGNLVLALALRLRDLGQPSSACVVAFPVWTDLKAAGESARSNDGVDAMFHYGNLHDFADVYLKDVSPAEPEASPLYGDPSGLPPLLLQVGSTALLFDDSRRFEHRVREAGGSCRMEVYDGAFHGWHMLVPFVPEAKTSLRSAARFIADCMDVEPYGTSSAV